MYKEKSKSSLRKENGSRGFTVLLGVGGNRQQQLPKWKHAVWVFNTVLLTGYIALGLLFVMVGFVFSIFFFNLLIIIIINLFVTSFGLNTNT